MVLCPHSAPGQKSFTKGLSGAQTALIVVATGMIFGDTVVIRIFCFIATLVARALIRGVCGIDAAISVGAGH